MQTIFYLPKITRFSLESIVRLFIAFTTSSEQRRWVTKDSISRCFDITEKCVSLQLLPCLSTKKFKLTNF